MDPTRFRRAALMVVAMALMLSASGVASLGDGPPTATAATGPTVSGCPTLPTDNIWNARVDALPVHPRSASYISSIGATTGLKADFGAGLWNGGPIGISFVTVPGTQPKVPVRFDYADESDSGPYPIPPNPPIEGGASSDGDRHVLVVDRDNCVLYELFGAYPQPDGTWTAGSGAIFPLTSNALRPAGWTSADAAGLPILPGLVRYEEVAAGQIAHALRFTAQVTQRAYVWPARHFASSNTSLSVPPMGIRVRLKANVDISRFSPETRVLLQALKTYGMLLADNGSNWYVSGVPDERWNNTTLRELANVKGSSFEVVDTASLMVNANSGQVAGGAPPPTPTPTVGPPSPTPTSTTAPLPTATPTSGPTTDRPLVIRGAAALADTWITPDEPTVAHGAWGQAHLQGSFTPDRLLFQPNLRGLPTSAKVQRATLELYAYQANSTGNSLSAYQVLRVWKATTATYKLPWSQPGLAPGADFAATPIGTSTVSGAGWLSVDVTTAVRGWLAGSANRGLMLRLDGGNPAAHYRVYLAEASDASLRPRLSVVYR